MNNRLEHALDYQRLGWNPVPAATGGKTPLGTWKRWQTERIPERQVREAFGGVERNIFLITGSVSRLCVVDCDDRTAVRWWAGKLGEPFKRTTRVKTARGYQFYFRLPEGLKLRGRSNTEGDGSGEWDFRAEGGGVIAPPSVHKTGHVYQFVEGHDLDALEDLPEATKGLFDADAGDEGAQPRSVLTHLLTHPPAGEGSRNNWLAQVAGHYARHLPYYDAYETLVREAAEKLTPPLPEEEIAKMLGSIWTAESTKARVPDPNDEEEKDWRRRVAEPTEDTGWLVSGGNCILVQVKAGSGQESRLELARWCNADLHVLGMIDSEDSGRTYEIEILVDGEDPVEGTLPSSIAADARRLAAWLANYGVSIGPPDNIWPRRMHDTTRLLRYLEAQEAESMEAVSALGWHDESASFVTHEGIIRADGPAPFERVRPDVTARKWAPYRYGHADREETRRVLQEVLTFHHETVAAVFGSWLVACLLKPQISAVSSQFPFMALEAASESGKTTGFFSLMLQLAGSAQGHVNSTKAALRDSLSAHRSGVVWMDDLDTLDDHGELLRAVTGEGSIVKKGQDNSQQVVAHLRAALVISGENLGLRGQKALLDRAVLLEVPSPTDRMSIHNEEFAQWDDILSLRRRYPDLTDLAGTVVQLALEQTHQVERFRAYRNGAGRDADKLAVVRLGARILADMADAEWVIEKVDAWAAGAVRGGHENTLTLSLIPRALADTGWKSLPEGPDPTGRYQATPAFVQQEDELSPVVWFSPKLMARWQEQRGGRVRQRVESEEALVQQARAIGLGGKKGKGDDCGRRLFRYTTNNGTQVYWKIEGPLAALLLERSRGEDDQDG